MSNAIGGLDQSHGSARGSEGALAWALGITTGVLGLEVVGGLFTGSLALLADAGHMATDVAALGLALLTRRLAMRTPTPRLTYGLLRVEVMAATVNALTLVAASLLVFREAYHRMGSPPEVATGPMLGVALVGLAANAVSIRLITRGDDHRHDLNTRGAFLHLVGDLFGSVAAIGAALLMLTTGWYAADPILSAIVGLLMFVSAFRLLRESIEILLEAAPRSVDPAVVRQAIEATPGVASLHDLHVWTVASGVLALTGRVVISPGEPWDVAVGRLTTEIRGRFGVAHITLQPEVAPRPGGAPEGCSLFEPAPLGRDYVHGAPLHQPSGRAGGDMLGSAAENP